MVIELLFRCYNESTKLFLNKRCITNIKINLLMTKKKNYKKLYYELKKLQGHWTKPALDIALILIQLAVGALNLATMVTCVGVSS